MYKKFADPKILYIFDKTFVLSIICGEYGNKNDITIKGEESIEILKIIGLTDNMKWIFIILNV